MGGGRWLIACAGDWPESEIWLPLTKSADRIIAVDAGLGKLVSRGIRYDLLIGDLDSVSTEELEGIPTQKIIRVDSQTETDLSKALAYCLANRATRVDVIGVEGGRSDHVLGAFAALCETPPDLEVILHMSDCEARLLPAQPGENISGQFTAGKHVSLFALAGVVKGLRLEGFEHEVDSLNLPFSTRGIHNVCTEGPSRISYSEDSEGRLLLMVFRS